ncbi:uncharacterized protein KD926_006969 [Aspergillus affinis]|uniref:uncharacterized protein n=1 Tax=Aspergillus affinis TaxID=1070780 RepID=UPI0022FE099C|nr:uncharacterized protein KD926_006969 [Aspergillus affinis]KAI9041393.1 hypothetical protein KD926_006969 [Aspergillus affinis]
MMDLPPLPVARDGFEYYNDEFYAIVPPHRRHRRSSIPELRAIFNSTPKMTSVKDKPAHWYRAQLIHYGLQPTDNKDTAAMRLLDALNKDTLKVPGSVQRLERLLKKEYSYEKNLIKEKKASSAKRKALSKQKAQFKQKTPSKKKPKAPATKKRVRDITDLDDNGGLSSLASQAVENSRNSGCLGISVANLNVNVNVGGLDRPRKSAKATPTVGVKPESVAPQDSGSSRSMCPRPILGCLDGVYKIDSLILSTCNSDMIICLDDLSLWGNFQLGCVKGVLYMAECPWPVCNQDGGGLPFVWRARDCDTGLGIRGEKHSGEMRFMGDGNIDGIFHKIPDGKGKWVDCLFQGKRVSGGSDYRAPRDSQSMRLEFETHRSFSSGQAPRIEELSFWSAENGDELQSTRVSYSQLLADADEKGRVDRRAQMGRNVRHGGVVDEVEELDLLALGFEDLGQFEDQHDYGVSGELLGWEGVEQKDGVQIQHSNL